ELARLAANDGDHQRQARVGGARHGVRGAADGNPERDRLLDGLRVDVDAGNEPGVLAAGPLHWAALADLEEHGQLFLEQIVIVVEVVAEERKALDEAATTGHDFGATIADQVDGGELLPDADRILGTE